uniref:UHRF1 binding protein 1-like n=1 Tax=Eptatretus burgeri TaxID=7764 RepID=A0A8C4QHS0_EPTBU
MAGLIKKQILKHLSRFTKNLSPDKINVSTLRGEGQLTNLELDETVLQDMLDLPTWLAITRVFCNRAAVRIQWTKLKTHPISLVLDKVEVEMETCEEPRPPNGPSPIAAVAGQSEYGFAEKVVEGMSLSVASIVVKISAKAFEASLQLSQLRVCSMNPSWQSSDLRFTRILDPNRGQVLTFKELEWQTLRIELDVIHSKLQDTTSTPLRLITNQAKIRIVLKRKLEDCHVLTSKLTLVLDDLLWVLTDSQLCAMVQYAQSLKESIERSAQQRKNLAGGSVQVGSTQHMAQSARGGQPDPGRDSSEGIGRLFERYDVKETSYHAVGKRLDLHLCDDNSPVEKGHGRCVSGGALQVTLHMLTMDYYPFHRAGASCKHWENHSAATDRRGAWAKILMERFRSLVAQLHKAGGCESQRPESENSHESLASRSATSPESKERIGTKAEVPSQRAVPTLEGCRVERVKLLSSCVVLRIEDLNMYQVSTMEVQRNPPEKLISCNKSPLLLPPDIPAIYAEFTEYYFPDEMQFPVPSSNLYIQLNALQLAVDSLTMLWLSRLVMDISQSLEQCKQLYLPPDSQGYDEHLDIRVDVLMSKVIFPAEKPCPDQPKRPRAIALQISEGIATNVRLGANCETQDLEKILAEFEHEKLFDECFTIFPKDEKGFKVLYPMFLRHVKNDKERTDANRSTSSFLTVNLFKTPSSEDLWSVSLSQFWIDYEGKGRPLCCVDSVPVVLWLCRTQRGLACSSVKTQTGEDKTTVAGMAQVDKQGEGVKCDFCQGELKEDKDGGSYSDADIHVLLYIPTTFGVQMEHDQYLFLLRLQQSLQVLQQQLKQDHTNVFGQETVHLDVCIGLLAPGVELVLLMHPSSGRVQTIGEDKWGEGCTATRDSTSLSEEELSTGAKEGLADGTVWPGVGKEIVEGSTDVIPGRESDLTEENAILVKDLKVVNKSLATEGSVLEGELSGLEAFDIADKLEENGKFAEVKESDLTEMPCGQIGENKEEEPAPTGQHAKTTTENQTSHATATTPMCRKPVEMHSGVKKVGLNSTKIGLSTQTSKEALLRPWEQTSQNFPQGKFKLVPRTISEMSLETALSDGCLTDDTISLDSDGSDNFILLNLDASMKEVVEPTAEDCGAQSPAESADGALGEKASRCLSPESSPSWSGNSVQDMASVLIFSIRGVTCQVNFAGPDMTVALLAQRVMPEELGNVNVKEFLSKRSAGSGDRRWHAQSSKTLTDDVHEVALRLEIGPCAGKHSPLSVQNGFLQTRLCGLCCTLHLSSLTNFAYFLEDEVFPDVLPLQIEVINCKIHLKNDSPSVNATSPGPIPMDLYVEHVTVQCQDDGTFYIMAGSDHTGSFSSCVGNDVELQRSSRSKHETLEEENRRLRAELWRMEQLLASQQHDTERLQNELESRAGTASV